MMLQRSIGYWLILTLLCANAATIRNSRAEDPYGGDPYGGDPYGGDPNQGGGGNQGGGATYPMKTGSGTYVDPYIIYHNANAFEVWGETEDFEDSPYVRDGCRCRSTVVQFDATEKIVLTDPATGEIIMQSGTPLITRTTSYDQCLDASAPMEYNMNVVHDYSLDALRHTLNPKVIGIPALGVAAVTDVFTETETAGSKVSFFTFPDTFDAIVSTYVLREKLNGVAVGRSQFKVDFELRNDASNSFKSAEIYSSTNRNHYLGNRTIVSINPATDSDEASIAWSVATCPDCHSALVYWFTVNEFFGCSV